MYLPCISLQYSLTSIIPPVFINLYISTSVSSSYIYVYVFIIRISIISSISIKPFCLKNCEGNLIVQNCCSNKTPSGCISWNGSTRLFIAVYFVISLNANLAKLYINALILGNALFIRVFSVLICFCHYFVLCNLTNSTIICSQFWQFGSS